MKILLARPIMSVTPYPKLADFRVCRRGRRETIPLIHPPVL
jgi:hypothetical protein